MEQITVEVEGKFYGQETTGTRRPTRSGVALEALEGSKTISQLSSEHEIHLNLIRVHTGRNRGPAGRRGPRM